MTDGFAATVAATGPVIVLVGIVEMRDAFSRMAELERERERRGVGDFRWASKFSRGEAPPSWRTLLLPLTHRLYGYLAVGWLAVLAYLLVAEVFALQWLATPNAGPHPARAETCFNGVVVGMVAIVVTPLLRFMHRFVMSVPESS